MIEFAVTDIYGLLAVFMIMSFAAAGVLIGYVEYSEAQYRIDRYSGLGWEVDPLDRHRTWGYALLLVVSFWLLVVALNNLFVALT